MCACPRTSPAGGVGGGKGQKHHRDFCSVKYRRNQRMIMQSFHFSHLPNSTHRRISNSPYYSKADLDSVVSQCTLKKRWNTNFTDVSQSQQWLNNWHELLLLSAFCSCLSLYFNATCQLLQLFNQCFLRRNSWVNPCGKQGLEVGRQSLSTKPMALLARTLLNVW